MQILNILSVFADTVANKILTFSEKTSVLAAVATNFSYLDFSWLVQDSYISWLCVRWSRWTRDLSPHWFAIRLDHSIWPCWSECGTIFLILKTRFLSVTRCCVTSAKCFFFTTNAGPKLNVIRNAKYVTVWIQVTNQIQFAPLIALIIRPVDRKNNRLARSWSMNNVLLERLASLLMRTYIYVYIDIYILKLQ